jgi:RNA polymerase sigma-70 factor (ECF subfamily)
MSNTHSIDTKVLHALKQGDSHAFEAVFSRYYAKIYHFALAALYNKSLAEDITQNVFLSVWENRKRIVTEKNFSAYLFTIAKNLVYDETKKRVLDFRYEDYVKRTLHEEDYSSEEKLEANSLEGLIIQLIEKLPEARRKVIMLHFTEDLSNKEIAAKLSISEKNVEMQIRRSLAYIRKHLKDYVTAIALLYMP